MGWITLTTDFGLEDGYAGILKGVIWRIAPAAQVADLSHAVSPQDILGGALVLECATPYFPTGTVHIAVVDPGVGTRRRPIAAHIGECYFVGPDNGLCTLLLRRAEELCQPVQIVRLNNPRYWLDDVSSSFHGRDIFAPVGAHIANGVPLGELGDAVRDPLLLDIPVPQSFRDGLRGQVIHIDHFGNVATSFRRSHLEHLGRSTALEVHYRGQVVRGLAETYGQGRPGSLLAMFDSSGCLALCVVNGNAAHQLGASVGDPVEVLLPRQVTSQ